MKKSMDMERLENMLADLEKEKVIKCTTLQRVQNFAPESQSGKDTQSRLVTEIGAEIAKWENCISENQVALEVATLVYLASPEYQD